MLETRDVGWDINDLIYPEMMHGNIFCCSRQQQCPGPQSSLIILGMREIHFAINCPHVA